MAPLFRHYVSRRFCWLSRRYSQTSSLPNSNIFNVETSNGITEFIGQNEKVIGTIKESPADYQIHEIDPSGNKIQLTDLTPPSVQNVDCDGGRTINFTLYKDGVDHSQALGFIVKQLKTTPRDIRFSQRKEKWAQTNQRFSVNNWQKGCPLQMSSDCGRMKLGNFDLSDSCQEIPLEDKAFRGNHFKILIRNVQPHPHNKGQSSMTQMMEEGMKNLKDFGFINYYPLDRMGIEDYRIGRAILQQNWAQVFDLMMTPHPNDEDYVTEVKSVWWSERDPEKMLTLIPDPDEYDYDSRLLSRICCALSLHYTGDQEFGRVYKKKLPRRLRRQQVEAFLRFHWNHMASFRVKTFGMEVIPGDFVVVQRPYSELISSNPQQQRYHKKLVSKEELENKKFSIHDVLLPFLGTKVHGYHNPTVQKFNRMFLLQHGIPADLFISLDSIMFEAGRGYYRPLLVRPENLEHKIIPLGEGENLNRFMLSDLHLLEDTLEYSSQDDGKNLFDLSQQDFKDKLSAIVEFSLPRESFVPSLLREFMQIANSDWLTKNKYF